MHAGQVIETSSGWLLEVSEVKWWSEDDGAVYGRAFAVNSTQKRWTPEKCLGTVRGIEQLSVGARFVKR